MFGCLLLPCASGDEQPEPSLVSQRFRAGDGDTDCKFFPGVKKKDAAF